MPGASRLAAWIAGRAAPKWTPSLLFYGICGTSGHAHLSPSDDLGLMACTSCFVVRPIRVNIKWFVGVSPAARDAGQLCLAACRVGIAGHAVPEAARDSVRPLDTEPESVSAVSTVAAFPLIFQRRRPARSMSFLLTN